MLKFMKVQIVITAINLWNKCTKACIESIKTKHDYRILLIDNGSTDETIIEAGKLVSDKFSHKRNEENWGTCKSWNYGINDGFEREAEYVLVLNNDVLLHSNAIDRLIERFEKKQEDLVMTTMMDVRDECNKLGGPQKIFELKEEDKKDVLESEHPNFSAFMINKKCWEEVGEFDEGITTCYHEDNDYSRRIKLLRLKAITYPPALFYHYGSQTINQSVIAKIVGAQWFEKSREYYIKKWGGGVDKETYVFPFNDNRNSLRWTTQKSIFNALALKI